MKLTPSGVLGALAQLAALVAVLLLYVVIVTRGRPMDWLP
jgi:hypothetical protein